MSNCTRIYLLQSPFTLISSALIAGNGFFGSIGNSLILYILFRKLAKTKTHMLLLSLVLSDFLVCILLAPITSYQLADREALRDCRLGNIRKYFTVLFIGTSTLSVGTIAYDRYILLTKLKNYNKYMTVFKFRLLLILTWLIPGIVPFSIYISSHLYLFMVVFGLFFFPLGISFTSYIVVVRSIHKNQRKLKNYRQENKNQSGKQRKRKTSNELKEHRIHIQIARAVTLLITVFIVCLTPGTIFAILSTVNKFTSLIDKIYMQRLYTISILISQINSSLNPITHCSRNPEFQKYFFILFKRKQISANKSIMGYQQAAEISMYD